MKKNKLLVIIISLTLLFTVTTVTYAKTNKLKSSEVGKTYKQTVLSKKNKDKVVKSIGKEKIYESEVAYLKWQYDNSPDDMKPFDVSENTESSIIEKIAKDKLFLAEAKSNNVDLSDNDKEQIEKNILDAFNNNLQENQALIDSMGISKDEIIKIISENEINTTIQAKFISTEMLPLLLDPDFKTNDINLQNKIDDYKKNQDVSEMIKLYNAYKDSLYTNAENEEN